jgi:ribosomal protein S17
VSVVAKSLDKKISRSFSGTVFSVSDTYCVVISERKAYLAKYKRYTTKTLKFLVGLSKQFESPSVGDKVMFTAVSPISKRIRHVLVSKVL